MCRKVLRKATADQKEEQEVIEETGGEVGPRGSYKGPVAVSILVMNRELLLFPQNQAIQVLTLCWLQWVAALKCMSR